jgi:hypothetical protein
MVRFYLLIAVEVHEEALQKQDNTKKPSFLEFQLVNPIQCQKFESLQYCKGMVLVSNAKMYLLLLLDVSPLR